MENYRLKIEENKNLAEGKYKYIYIYLGKKFVNIA